MKRIIFALSVMVIVLSINACKSTKQTSNVNEEITEKYWKLFELYGNPMVPASKNAKEAHIIFRVKDRQFNADAGCNMIIGNYELKDFNRIVISPNISTLKMCFDMTTETQFLKVLEMADSYSIRNDTLTLNRARMAPLARFTAVYLR
jgi:heat shock protein HslJ